MPQVPAALAELKRVADTVGAPFWVRELILYYLLRYFDLAKLCLQPSLQLPVTMLFEFEPFRL